MIPIPYIENCLGRTSFYRGAQMLIEDCSNHFSALSVSHNCEYNCTILPNKALYPIILCGHMRDAILRLIINNKLIIKGTVVDQENK